VKERAACEGGAPAVRTRVAGRLEVPVGQARLAQSSLARLHVGSWRTQINREHCRRFLAYKCNIEGRDMGRFVGEAQARVAAGVRLPEGYHLSWGGEFENQRRAMKRLGLIVPISVLVIFLLLHATFRAAVPALVALLDVPFATVGGVFTLYPLASARHRAGEGTVGPEAGYLATGRTEGNQRCQRQNADGR
jgi:Cu/Ag efflux pump CusA